MKPGHFIVSINTLHFSILNTPDNIFLEIKYIFYKCSQYFFIYTHILAADTRPFIPCFTFCPALRFHVPFTCTRLNTVSFCRLRFSIVEFSRDGWLGTAGWRISGVLTVKGSSGLSICEASINNGMRCISRNLGGACAENL